MLDEYGSKEFSEFVICFLERAAAERCIGKAVLPMGPLSCTGRHVFQG